MTTAVKLSAETLAILKTAQQVNNSIRIEAGNSIKTVSVSGSVIFEAEVAEVFPEPVNIYELNRLLSVLSLANMKGADLIFDNKNYVEIRAGKSSVKYKFTTLDFVTHPGKSIVLPSEDLKVELNSTELQNIQKMAGVLGHKFLEFRVDGGKCYLRTMTPDLNDASNDSLVELSDVPGTDDGVYKLNFDNLILPDGDYDVTICKAGITKFQHKTKKITVFIGLEMC